MKTFFTSAIIVICICYPWMQVIAQVQQAWVQQYAESYPDGQFAVDIKTDGAFVYVLGVKYSQGVEQDALLLKYSSSGALIWERTYNSAYDDEDEPAAMAMDAAGNIYVVGTSRFFNGESTSETFTLKYNNDGTLLWASTYLRADNNSSRLTSVAVDASGNVYAAGETDPGSYDYDFLTIKYNSSGVQQWIQTFNGNNDGYDGNTRVAVDASGNIYVTGESDAKVSFHGMLLYISQDFRTIKYDANGNTIWSKSFATAGDDRPKAIAVDGSSNVYIAGEGNGPYETDYLTVKYASNGTLLWSKFYNGPADEDDQCTAMVVNSAGECYVTGLARDTPGVGSYKTIKYSALGSQLWVRTYGGVTTGAGAKAIALDGFGNVYVTGSAIDTVNALAIATVKYSSSGTQSWVMTFNGSPASFDLPYAIAVHTPTGSPLLRPSVYVAGDFQTPGSNTERYLLTIKYTQNVVLGPFTAVGTVTNFPNPFASGTTFVYELAEESQVTLHIVDMISGREVESISIGKQPAGLQQYLYQSDHLPKGNYAYTIVAASATGRSVQSSVMRKL